MQDNHDNNLEGGGGTASRNKTFPRYSEFIVIENVKSIKLSYIFPVKGERGECEIFV